MVRMHRLIPLAIAVALIMPASAYGAAAREYQLQYAPVGEGTGTLMIVSGLLDPQTPLPAEITIPAPAGATLLWAGEVLGGDPAADPAREVTVETVGGMDVYTLTLEQAYTAQLELQLGQPTVSGDRVESTVTWTNPGEEVLVTASVVAEPGATDVKTDPEVSGEIQINSVGETLHPLTGRRVAEGDSYVITAEWKRGGEATTDESPLLPILLGALVVAVLALVIVLARERTRARRASDASSV